MIREMVIQDLDAVISIEKTLFTDPWLHESFRYEIEDNKLSHYFVITENDEIMGYFGFIILLDECQIYNVAVKKEFQHQGYGKKMLQFIIDYCKERDVKWVILEVREFNFHALELYEKFGFKRAARIRGYYRHPLEDGILMKLELSK